MSSRKTSLKPSFWFKACFFKKAFLETTYLVQGMANVFLLFCEENGTLVLSSECLPFQSS
jgi:hypothetical protein